MLAKLACELPRGDYLYEPKWDGFRCLAFRSGDEVDLRSRHGRPLARYFPEVAAAIAELPHSDLALDGELVLLGEHRFDFSVLMSRLHPAASRVDLLALDDGELAPRPFRERRAELERLLENAREGAVRLTPATEDPEAAARW